MDWREGTTNEPLFDHQRTLLRLLAEFDHPVMAEVGVASGRTSEILLRECPALRLYMVDHWKAPLNHPRRDQALYDRAYETACQRTAFASERRVLIRRNSVVAAQTMPARVFFQSTFLSLFDVAFIDAHHGYESVLMDCVAWWPKLKAGGVLSGHDIDSRKDRAGVWGVRRAVELFSATVGVPFTVEKNTWIMRKP